MRKLITALTTSAIVLGIVPRVASAQEPEFVLIVNQANPVVTLRRADASKLFLRKQTKWPGGKAVLPIDQLESSPVRRKFSDTIHRMDVPSIKSFWQEIVFSGRGEPPPERAADADIVAYVKGNPNAIGYIGRVTPAIDVKVIPLTP